MRPLREYLGVLLAVCLVAVPGLLLPVGARVGLERVLREALVTPTQVITSWALLHLWWGTAGHAAKADPAEPDAHAGALRLRWQRVLPETPSRGGLRATPMYRAAFDLAFRDRYAPLPRLVAAPVLSARDELFREPIRLGCGRMQGVLPGAGVFTAQGYLVGVVDDVTRLTCTLSRLGADHVRVHCDILGRDGVQGILAGPWRQRPSSAGSARAKCLELQIVSRGTSVKVDDTVVTSSFAGTTVQGQLPGGIPIGWVDGVEATEEGYYRARVRVVPSGPSRVLYAMSSRSAPDDPAAEPDPAAAQARYQAELRRVVTFERDLIPGAIRHLVGVWRAGEEANTMARIAFAIRSRARDTFYRAAEPAGPEALGLRAGVPCLSNGSLAGVVVSENECLRVRLLTSPDLAIRVEVIQPDGVRYPGLLAAADGPLAEEAVPDGWSLPGQPRLQLVKLENDGLPVQLPADVITASGGAVALPPGIPVGRLVSGPDDPFSPAWRVVPYADFGALTYCIALIPTATHALNVPRPAGGDPVRATPPKPPAGSL